jgi:hypothetical protein
MDSMVEKRGNYKKNPMVKLVARIQNCIFSWYSNITKAFCIYDEVNKKFILSIDVIFLESTKNDKTVE